MEHLNWGLPVAFDVFFAGLGAGAFLLAVAAQLAGAGRHRAINIAGAAVAPWPVILGVLLLVADLGKPLRFWEMLLRSGEGLLMFNPSSTMSIGTWLLTIFVVISLVYLVLTLLALLFPATVGPIGMLVGVAGLPVAILVTVYTGVLISSTVNNLWNTPLLAPLFVASAFATGVASVVFVLALVWLPRSMAGKASPVPMLEKVVGAVLAVQLAAALLFMLGQKDSTGLRLMVGHGYGLLWWIGIVGLGTVVPLIYGLKRKIGEPRMSLVVSTLVLLGGFFLRYVILMAGQMA